MCVDKSKRSNKYTYLLYNNSITSLPDSSANKSPTRPMQSTSIRIPTSSCTNRYCLFLRRNRRRRYGTVVRKCCSSSLPASATRRRLDFLRNGSARLKNPTVSIHDACVDNVSLDWALIGRSNRCKERTVLNIHCIPMHLAISGLDLVNVYGSAPELKQSSHTWQQKEAKFLVFGLWGTASQPNFFQRWCRFTWACFSPDYYFWMGWKGV